MFQKVLKEKTGKYNQQNQESVAYCQNRTWRSKEDSQKEKGNF
mgnify:CR=1 FL=1